ncbi:rCG59748 [Rattus norvegicus]|uniref:RCG59748 n=1 Tax=Rattus norvegicus TaxID=10116 RepID=A6HRT7_RAT|nr:rCG59748 [Rattus norvegicus]
MFFLLCHFIWVLLWNVGWSETCRNPLASASIELGFKGLWLHSQYNSLIFKMKFLSEDQQSNKTFCENISQVT